MVSKYCIQSHEIGKENYLEYSKITFMPIVYSCYLRVGLDRSIK